MFERRCRVPKVLRAHVMAGGEAEGGLMQAIPERNQEKQAVAQPLRRVEARLGQQLLLQGQLHVTGAAVGSPRLAYACAR